MSDPEQTSGSRDPVAEQTQAKKKRRKKKRSRSQPEAGSKPSGKRIPLRPGLNPGLLSQVVLTRPNPNIDPSKPIGAAAFQAAVSDPVEYKTQPKSTRQERLAQIGKKTAASMKEKQQQEKMGLILIQLI